MYRKILLPIDITEPAMTDRAIAVAQELAKAFNSEMRLVNVQSLLPVAFLDYVPENFDLQMRHALEKEIAEIAGKIDRPPERVS
ncbi:MAG: universal stress protein, partial [Methylocystis sp.]